MSPTAIGQSLIQCVLIAGHRDGSDDEAELVGPTPKRRVLMPREASLNAKARMVGQSEDKSSSNPSGDMSHDTIPETQGTIGGDPLASDPKTTSSPPAFLNNSLPANTHNVHLNVGSVTDPVVTGSHLYNPANAITPSSYQSFVSGLQGQQGQQTVAGTSQMQPTPGTTSTQNPPPKKQGKKKTSATVTQSGAGASPGSQDRLDIYMQHSQHQYAQLNAQVQALVGSITGLHSWLQMPAASMALAGHPGMAPGHNNAPPIYPCQVPMAYPPSGLSHSAVISGQMFPSQGNNSNSSVLQNSANVPTQGLQSMNTQNTTITQGQVTGTGSSSNTLFTNNTQPNAQSQQVGSQPMSAQLGGPTTTATQPASTPPTNTQPSSQIPSSIPLSGVTGTNSGNVGANTSLLVHSNLSGQSHALNTYSFNTNSNTNQHNHLSNMGLKNTPYPPHSGNAYGGGMNSAQQNVNSVNPHTVYQPIPVYAAGNTSVFGTSVGNMAGTSLCPPLSNQQFAQNVQQSQLGGTSGFPGVIGNYGTGGTTCPANTVNTHTNSHANWTHLAGGSRVSTGISNPTLYHPSHAKNPNNYYNIHNLSTVPGIPPSGPGNNPMPQQTFSLYRGGIPASAVNYQGGQNWQNFQHSNLGQHTSFGSGGWGQIAPQGGAEEKRKRDGRMPVGWAVPLEIKEKIWKEEFVEFGDLLDDNVSSKQTITVDCESGTTVERQRKKREITCIRDWDRAYATYLNIYVQRPEHLKHLFHLVTYGQTIKNMAEHGLDFLKYDEKFRRERASQVSEGEEPWSWDTFRQETYNNLQSDVILKKLKIGPKKWYADSGFNSFSGQDSGKNSVSKVPMGFCFDFHTLGKSCLKEICSYRHTCPCGRGPHNLYACRSGGKPPSRGRGGNSRGRGRGKNPNTTKE